MDAIAAADRALGDFVDAVAAPPVAALGGEAAEGAAAEVLDGDEAADTLALVTGVLELEPFAEGTSGTTAAAF